VSTCCNVTMIAFHGKTKPTQLQELLTGVLNSIKANLSASAAKAFTAYDFKQMHATILEMEADIVDGRIISRWWKKNGNEERDIDIERLHEVVKGIVDNNRLLSNEVLF
jgi:hypothetical protein